jgi:hypothetical protein
MAGWFKATDDSGHAYYYNDKGDTAWEVPESDWEETHAADYDAHHHSWEVPNSAAEYPQGGAEANQAILHSPVNQQQLNDAGPAKGFVQDTKLISKKKLVKMSQKMKHDYMAR